MCHKPILTALILVSVLAWPGRMAWAVEDSPYELAEAYALFKQGRCAEALPTFARIEAEGIVATRERLVKSWFVDGEHNPYYPMCRAAGEGVGAEAAVATLKMTQRWDVRERLRDIKVPVMLIGGDLDRNVGPQQLFDQWRAIEGARLAFVPGCAHNVHLEKPELFHRMVEDFLSEPPPG